MVNQRYVLCDHNLLHSKTIPCDEASQDIITVGHTGGSEDKQLLSQTVNIGKIEKTHG